MPPRSPAPAHRWAVLGRIVVADRPLPGLPIAPVGSPAPFLPLHVHEAAAAEGLDAPMTNVSGTVSVTGGPVLTLAEAGEGRWSLDVSDTGRWTVTADRLDLALRHGADLRAVALDLVGHAVPLALHAGGIRTLHAAAVATPAGALLLVAPRGAGKSTLAAACATHGAPLAADDAAPVAWRDGVPHLLPTGLPIRLRHDTAAALDLTGDDDGWGKRRVALPLADPAPIAIAAIAIVTPSEPDAPLAVDPLPARAAAAHLAAGWKLAPLLGHADVPAALTAAAELAAAVPVLRVAVPRDLARLRSQAAAVLAHVADRVPGAPRRGDAAILEGVAP